MKARVNPKWQDKLRLLIKEKIGGTFAHEIDELVTFNPAAQWLISQLVKVDRPYKIFNYGAGVKRITTRTDTCPLCKKKLG